MNNFGIIQKSAGIFALNGIIDKKTVSALWKRRHELIAEDNTLVIDLATITHSDSAGLALLTCLKKIALQSGQQISFINIPVQLQQLIELSHLEDILNNPKSG